MLTWRAPYGGKPGRCPQFCGGFLPPARFMVADPTVWVVACPLEDRIQVNAADRADHRGYLPGIPTVNQVRVVWRGGRACGGQVLGSSPRVRRGRELPRR